MAVWQVPLILAAGFIGGMLNSIAGGGTLVTFPTLIACGLPPIQANATNALALWPGSLSGAWGYRQELKSGGPRFMLLLVPSLLGGLLGAVLLRHTPPSVFAAMVPFLILFATLLFLVQEPARRAMRRRREMDAGAIGATLPVAGIRSGAQGTVRWWVGAALLQLLAATYGGYFGAGMGIVMLAILGWIGLQDIHQMNGLKNVFSFAVNLVAAVYFAAVGLVHWPHALVMMVGSLAGGYASAGVARQLGREFARRAVIVIGLAIALSLLVRR